MKTYNFAIVGATGLVGRKFLEVLEDFNMPINKLYLYASKRSKGKKIIFKGKEYTVIELKESNIKNDIDIALFSAGSAISRDFTPLFVRKGAVVIDNSSAFRTDESVPLIVPEVNPNDVDKHNGIISNPNCSTIQAVLPLVVLDENYGVKRVVYSTYQSVSGSGIKGVKDLEKTLKNEEASHFPHPIANNCLPHIDVFMDNGYTKEEIKMIEETKKILSKRNLEVSATCVRVPVKNSHSVNISTELEKEFDIKEIKNLFMNKDGIVLMDNPKKDVYPLATYTNGEDEVFVGRIRKDLFNSKILHLWCVADNIRKGAATNTVQIAKLIIERGVL